jgi:hypothetical protein
LSWLADQIHRKYFYLPRKLKTIMNPIPVERTTQSRLSTIDFSNLGFGNHISDHMLVADYKNGKWHEPKVVPYGDLAMSPAMLSLHYGQSIFEGMKAFKIKMVSWSFSDLSVIISVCSNRWNVCACLR